METLALILAGGKGSRLDLLSQKRSKPAVPFAGKYRIIDFTLSNCAQSGIYDIGILTQYLPFSLNEHIGVGKPWDLDRRDSGVVLLHPHNQWYLGTADAVLRNIEFVKRKNAKYVLILSGDHIYKMDYRAMIEKHVKTNADLTIATIKVDPSETNRFGMMEVDSNDSIIDFEEKPLKTNSTLASMGIYLFNKQALIDALNEVVRPDLDFGKDIIPYLIKVKKSKVVSHTFEGYWQDVGTYDSYLETSIALTKSDTKLDLYDEEWKIYTRSEEKPPVKIGSKAKIENSLISNGCIIEGTVINSVLSPGVIVEAGAIIEDSVILNDSVIKKNSIINKCIFDKKVVIEENSKVGFGNDYTPNIEKPDVLFSGITVLEKHSVVPKNMIIGRNVRIYKDANFSNQVVKSGSSIK